jgi:hypothetical protein
VYKKHNESNMQADFESQIDVKSFLLQELPGNQPYD